MHDEVAPDVVPPHEETVIEPAIKCLDTVIALYNFPGTQSSHLALDLGDTIHVLAKNDSGWWDGVCVRNGDMVRGWFPRNYVRSVNYVQPMLKQLQNNKELDTLTAANTAANVLIPLFTSLLQKNLLDSGRDGSASNTRKNSVVSFASLEGDKRHEPLPPPHQMLVSTVSDVPAHQMLVNSASDSPAHQMLISTLEGTPLHQMLVTSAVDDSNDIIEPEETRFVQVEEAEALELEYRRAHRKKVVWLPRATDGGNIAFYSEILNVCCETLPLVPFDPGLDNPAADPNLPSLEAVKTSLRIFKTHSYDFHSEPMLRGSLRANSSLNDSYDSAKRDSNASGVSQNSSSLYHNFRQPFFNTPNLFWNHYSDVTHWPELEEKLNYILGLTHKALRDSNKQLYNVHLLQLTKGISIVFQCSRLLRSDYVGTKYERSVRRKLNRVSESFSQLNINGLLHMSVMHFSNASSSAELFSLDIRSLNKSTSTPSTAQHSTSSISTDDTVRKSVSNRPFTLPTSLDTGPQSYLAQIDQEVDTLRYNLKNIMRIFTHLSRDKKVFSRDYDSSDISEDEGESRYNVLPQVYPRFICNEFNGGNWCNPFFTDSHPFLNLSGDQLKNRYHLKVIIDRAAYDKAKTNIADINRYGKEVLYYLEPAKQSRYHSTSLMNERNDNIVRIMYKFLHNASCLIDHMESFDFTVFCLIKKSDVGDDGNQSGVDFNENGLQKALRNSRTSQQESDHTQLDSGTTPEAPEESSRNPSSSESSFVAGDFASNLTFDYPMVLEFFQRKQQLHDMLGKIIMQAQSLTLEDPDVFIPMDDNNVLIDREALKDPIERSAMLLSGILADQSQHSSQDRIYLNQDKILADMLVELNDFFEDILNIITRLIDERETILNYATRVMHDDFNIELLVVERNNTVTSTKGEDIQYFSEKTQDTNTPWYLEGDEEFDLLLDSNGNIRGGTKEALVAHLTHHKSIDSTFNTIFLTSFATMMTIGELIQMLSNRFNIEAPEGLSYEEYLTWRTQKRDKVRLRVLDIIKLLLENHWCQSYTNSSLLLRLLKFLNLKEVQQIPISKALVDDITYILDGGIISTEKEVIIVGGKPPAPLLKSFSLRKIKLSDIEYVELARQLTLREFKLYCKISKLSSIHKVWGKRSGLNESIDNITDFIKASNQLTNFVAYMILRKDDVRKRVQVIRFFVQVAEKCRSYNNFSSMTAIISALYSSPIHRLKKTWAMVSRDTMSLLQNMNKLMNSSRNFNEYRDMLKFIGLEPCVPFFGVYLSDLTFVLHGNPDNLLNRMRMINFAKRAKTVDIVTDIDRFKRMGYNFRTVAEIQNYIDLWFGKCPTIEEQYQLSLNIEPREVDDKKQAPKLQPAKRNPGVKPSYLQSSNLLGIR